MKNCVFVCGVCVRGGGELSGNATLSASVSSSSSVRPSLRRDSLLSDDRRDASPRLPLPRLVFSSFYSSSRRNHPPFFCDSRVGLAEGKQRKYTDQTLWNPGSKTLYERKVSSVYLPVGGRRGLLCLYMLTKRWKTMDISVILHVYCVINLSIFPNRKIYIF